MPDLRFSIVVASGDGALQDSADMMSLERATELTREIRSAAGSIRQALSEVYHGQGYLAMGYGNFAEYMVGEFDWSPQHGYRLKDAADIESDLRALVPDVPEDIPNKHLLALKPLASPVQRAQAYEDAVELAASEGSSVTERHIKASVATLDDRKRVFESRNAVVIQLMTVGTITVAQGVNLLAELEKLTPRKRGYLVQLMAEFQLVNPTLVAPIAEMFDRPPGRESMVLPEILTGYLNGAALNVATISDLAAAREEARQRHIAASKEAELQRLLAAGSVPLPPVIVELYPGQPERTLNALRQALTNGRGDWFDWLHSVMMGV